MLDFVIRLSQWWKNTQTDDSMTARLNYVRHIGSTRIVNNKTVAQSLDAKSCTWISEHGNIQRNCSRFILRINGQIKVSGNRKQLQMIYFEIFCKLNVFASLWYFPDEQPVKKTFYFTSLQHAYGYKLNYQWIMRNIPDWYIQCFVVAVLVYSFCLIYWLGDCFAHD